MKLSLTLLLAACALLSACSSNGLIRPGTVEVDGLLMRPSVAWTQRGLKGERQWTIDGPQLNALEIYTGIKDGEHIFKLNIRNKRDEGLRFRSGMNTLELQDLIIAGLKQAGAVDPQSEQLAPARISNLDGFSLRLRFANAQGLHYRAIGLGFIAGDQLQFLLFYAPKEYYYGRYEAEIERVFSTLTWRG